MWKRIFILILVFVILVGCGAQNDIAATPTSISLPTSTQQVLKPTLTLVATLSLENQLEIFTRLLEEDGECKLPCWWGIIPSQTTREEAVKIFESL
ncbi:MAG: hypothetical protein JNJ43_18700, partial [Anaerolineales bacterium]|nr:hypothetical protein [Anaerolineales bacterium]